MAECLTSRQSIAATRGPAPGAVLARELRAHCGCVIAIHTGACGGNNTHTDITPPPVSLFAAMEPGKSYMPSSPASPPALPALPALRTLREHFDLPEVSMGCPRCAASHISATAADSLGAEASDSEASKGQLAQTRGQQALAGVRHS